MKREHPDLKVIAAARALAAAEGKTDWRPFVKAVRLVEAALKSGRAEPLVEVFPGYMPAVSQGSKRLTSS